MSHARREIIGAKDIIDIWKGRIGKQVVAQELLTIKPNINETRHFWTRGKGEGGAEVDFVRIVDAAIVPIEVKAGHNSHLRSLHSFVDSADNCRVAVRVWSGDYQVEQQQTVAKRKPFLLINLPFYMIWNLDNIVRRELDSLNVNS